MKGAFDALGQADYGLFDNLASVGATLDVGAAEAIQQFQTGGAAAARARLKEDFGELFALRSELARTTKMLREMQNDFQALATGVPLS